MRTQNPDDRLAARALALGWSVPAKERSALVRAMINIVRSKSRKTTARAKVGAFKALTAVEKNNLDCIRTSIMATEHIEGLEAIRILRERVDEFEKHGRLD
jgi:uncharacterized membrane protein